MTTFTYRKVSYLNDPYQKYLLSKAKTEIKPNVKPYNVKNVKKEHRNTKLLLDVNEYGIFSNLDAFGNNNNNGLTPIGINLNNNIESGNGIVTSSNANSNSDIEKKKSFSNIKNGMLSPTSNTIKHSSFMNPLMNMSFNVGGIFDNDKDAGDVFSSILSKVDNDNENKYMESEAITEHEEYNKRIRNLKLANRLSQLSQDTVKMKHYSSPTDDRSFSFVTEKRRSSLRAITITEKYSNSYKDDASIAASTITEKPRSIASRKVNTGISNNDRFNNQNSIKGNTKMIGSFNNHLTENLNEQPTMFESENFFNNNDENNDIIADFYMDDDKIDQSFTPDWFDQYKDEENKESSVKSSRSKFSSFTRSSTKKLSKKAKKFYKKIIKQKQDIPIPLNPLEIPESYNEKERAFEEMIFRDDTINLTLSNTLTSTFADNNFPLTEDIDENNNEEEEINRDPDNSFVSSVVSSSVVSSVSNYEDGTLRKRRHRKAINFEEALKEGNEFRRSLANL